MAYYLKREGSVVSGCHYLDGIPVKISEKFRPPRKITLPLSYQQRCPVDLLNEEYDFSLENQVLELAETKRRGREAAERAKIEQLGTSIEEFTRLVCSEPKSIAADTFDSGHDNHNSIYPACDDEKNQTDVQQDVKDNNGQTSNSSRIGLGIASSLLNSLEPNSMLKPVLSSNEPSIALDKPDVTLTTKLNLEDFEAESSPFDSVALKTLNDIEELKSVLQNANLPSLNSNNGQGQQRVSAHMFNRNADDSQLNGTSMNNLSSQGSYATYNIPEDRSRSKDSDNTQYVLPVQQHVQSTCAPIAAEYPSLPSTVENQPLTSADDAERESRTVVHKSASNVQCQSLNSNLELDGDELSLINRITDMGFPRTRVKLVVSIIGDDDKKIVELLCVIQSFIERGYNTEDVEAAVFQCGHNKMQVKKYIELNLQFRDLGFDNDAIRRALAECDIDGDKALDRLVS